MSCLKRVQSYGKVYTFSRLSDKKIIIQVIIVLFGCCRMHIYEEIVQLGVWLIVGCANIVVRGASL